MVKVNPSDLFLVRLVQVENGPSFNFAQEEYLTKYVEHLRTLVVPFYSHVVQLCL